MKKRIAALVFGVTFGASIALGSGAALADKPGPAPSPHRHYMMVNGSKVYVGPDFCAVAASRQGWIAYHHMVHVTDPGVTDVFFEGCP